MNIGHRPAVSADSIEVWLIEPESRHKRGSGWTEWNRLGAWAVVGSRPASTVLDNYRTRVTRMVPA